MDKDTVRQLILEILQEQGECPVKLSRPAMVQLGDQDLLQTGDVKDRAYTRDLFSLSESPRLGCGVMEIRQSEFPWTMQYDEIDYVISGTLSVHLDSHVITAAPGEVILIPKGSKIRFAAKDCARFLYVTYPADWKAAK